MTVLQTPRLQLREFTPEDADALALVLSDPETMRYYPAPTIAPESRNGSNATANATRTTASASGPWS